MGAEMMFDDFRNYRGLPPSDSHRGWNFTPSAKPQYRLPIGYGLAAISIFSGLVWLAIVFH
jgi:hypothetical protein